MCSENAGRGGAFDGELRRTCTPWPTEDQHYSQMLSSHRATEWTGEPGSDSQNSPWVGGLDEYVGGVDEAPALTPSPRRGAR